MLFGWTCEVGEQEKYNGYTRAFKNGAAVAGLMHNDGASDYPDAWSTYLRVDDIDAVAAATAA